MTGLGAPAIVATIALPLLLGDALLRSGGLRRSEVGLAWPGWAYMTGLLAAALLIGAALLSGLPAPASGALCAGAILWLALTARLRLRTLRSPGAAVPEPAPTRFPAAESLLFAIVIAAACVAVVDRAIVARGTPVSNDDELFIWDVRGRALVAAGGINERYGELLREEIATPAGPHRRIRHADYPLLLPIVSYAMHTAAGGDAGTDVRLPVHLANLALVFTLAGALRRRLRPGAAAIVLWAVAGGRAAVFDGWFMADDLVALGFLAALDAIDRSRFTPNLGFGLVAAAGAACGAFAKNEGVAAAAAATIGAFFTSARARRAVVLPTLVGGAAIAAVQFAINARLGLRNDHFGGQPTGESFWAIAWRLRAERPSAVASILWRETLFGFGKNGGAFVAALAVAPLAPRTAASARGPFGPAVLMLCGAYAAVFIGTYHELAWHWATAGDRVFGQAAPAAAVWAAASAAAACPALGADRR